MTQGDQLTKMFVRHTRPKEQLCSNGSLALRTAMSMVISQLKMSARATSKNRSWVLCGEWARGQNAPGSCKLMEFYRRMPEHPPLQAMGVSNRERRVMACSTDRSCREP